MTSDSDRDSEYPGEHSRNVGLTVACLIDDEELPTLTCLTKGIVYELSLLRKAYNISWSQFYDWAKALGGGSIATFASFKVTVGRIEKKRVEIKSMMNSSVFFFSHLVRSRSTRHPRKREIQ